MHSLRNNRIIFYENKEGNLEELFFSNKNKQETKNRYKKLKDKKLRKY